jgi:predicted HicB family RNase H-like nuclease
MPKSSKPQISVNLSIPRTLHAAIAERAARELISLSDYHRRALLAQLQRDGIEYDARAAASHST